MNLDLKKLSLVLSILITLTTIIYGTSKYFNATYVYASDFKDHKLDTAYQFLHIKLDKLNNRIWEIEGKLNKRSNDINARKELDSLNIEKNNTIKNIQEIESIKLK